MKNYYELTPRENEVKNLLLKGYTNPEIAKTLYVSVHTAKAHVCNIFGKLGLKNRYELFIYEMLRLKSELFLDIDMHTVFQKIKEARYGNRIFLHIS